MLTAKKNWEPLIMIALGSVFTSFLNNVAALTLSNKGIKESKGSDFFFNSTLRRKKKRENRQREKRKQTKRKNRKKETDKETKEVYKLCEFTFA